MKNEHKRNILGFFLGIPLPAFAICWIALGIALWAESSRLFDRIISPALFFPIYLGVGAVIVILILYRVYRFFPDSKNSQGDNLQQSNH